ncbi:ankyrin repeat-containing domain protein [Aspergillus stella-maris]|uniref:ankyrin repeat-containing domain protein n=1 Tax=Aspergillus stella-maris TaxID=1810926 RepID=UPI003CCDD6DA
MPDPHSSSRSTKEVPSLTLLLEAAAKANNVDELSSILQQARSNAAFPKILGAGLGTAAQDGRVDIVKCLLSEDKKVLTYDNLLLALLNAVSAGHIDVVEQLLDSGAPVNGILHDGSCWDSWSPIAIAVLGNNAQVLKLLIARGGDVDVEGDNRQTALHMLAGKDSWETPLDSEALDMLLRASRKVHRQDSYGCTPLYYACMVNNAEMVRKILQQRRGLQVSLVAPDPTRYNAFHIACQHSSFGIVEMLLMHGADSNATRGDGWTPLHIACHRYNTSIVTVLLDHGASANPTTSNRILPLHLAIDESAVEVVKLLLQKDDIQTRDTFGDHLFFYAAERGESEIRDLLFPFYRSSSVSNEMLTCDMFTATVVDFDKEGQIMDLKNTTISTLLGWFTPQPPPQVPYAQPSMLR